MASSELDLARRHLALTARVRASKAQELLQAKALVERLQEQVEEAEQDMHHARESMHRIERQLEVVELDDEMDDNDYGDGDKENQAPKHPRVGLPLVPTHPFGGRGKRSNHSNNNESSHYNISQVLNGALFPLETTKENSTACRADSSPRLPAALRRSLKRHQRKLMRFAAAATAAAAAAASERHEEEPCPDQTEESEN